MTHAIEARGLMKSYGDVRVLRGVDITVRGGSVFALLGPNGADKTTTFRILATLLTACYFATLSGLTSMAVTLRGELAMPDVKVVLRVLTQGEQQ